MYSMSVNSAEPAVRGPNQGERNPAAKLTENQVRAIRTAVAAGGTLRHIAKAFGVSERTARHIVRGTTWRVLDGSGGVA